MQSAKAAARQHVRLMETRIERQRLLIEHLDRERQDTAEQARRLLLLQRALEEMLLQLGQLVPPSEEEPTGAAQARLPERMLGKE
ncbi:MAG TPA: hypothetical protein VFG64_20285 [Dongiaceae bacterium]|nr:hypothetical protein [Dongiaceae bacterium]